MDIRTGSGILKMQSANTADETCQPAGLEHDVNTHIAVWSRDFPVRLRTGNCRYFVGLQKHPDKRRGRSSLSAASKGNSTANSVPHSTGFAIPSLLRERSGLGDRLQNSSKAASCSFEKQNKTRNLSFMAAPP